MIDVFVEIPGESERRQVPRGPFVNHLEAHVALYHYAEETYGTYLAMIQAIDAYSFTVRGAGPGGQDENIRVSTKP